MSCWSVLWARDHGLGLQTETRKPSWRKGKRATAVRVWRSLAKKSAADQRCAISYWCLIVSGRITNVCEIFSCVEVENRHFCPLYSDCRPPSGGMTSNINVIYASLKSTFSGLQFCRWQYRSISIRLAVVASQICEIPRKFELKAVQGHPRSSPLVPIESAYATSC